MGTYLIRSIKLTHCKRGPDRCEKCREMEVEELCLLEVFLTGSGLKQRRVMAFDLDGSREWLEYDVVKVFSNRNEAIEYARSNDIHDIDF